MPLPFIKTTQEDRNITREFIKVNRKHGEPCTRLHNDQMEELLDDFEAMLTIILTHDICHDLHGQVGACEFAKGCEREQRRLFSQAPHADRLQDIRKKLEGIVCTEGCDEGVVLLSQDGPCHDEVIDGKTVSVYNHQYFSPLGDALIELYKMTEPL